jgi:dihydropteroate synthase
MAPVEFAWGHRTFVMAIVNATPDSFSGDGIATDIDAAVALAKAAAAAGADIIDVGGESTRPGHESIDAQTEIERVVPMVAAIAGAVDLPISIDTSKARVAEAALDAGARIINDVRGLKQDPELAAIAAESKLPGIVMHDAVPDPKIDLLASIVSELADRVERAISTGVAQDRVIVDPGFGFGKDWRQNLELLGRLCELKTLGLPILVGFSRKSTIGRVLDLPAEERLEGTLATTALAIAGGADIVRVHDVLPNVRVAKMADAVCRPGPVIE